MATERLPVGGARLRFSTRMALWFGALLVVGGLLTLRVWWAGLPLIDIPGIYDQRLAQASRLIELSADKHLQRITERLRESRGDVLVVAENRLLASALARRAPSLREDFTRVSERLQRAYPDVYRGLLLYDNHGALLASSDAPLGAEHEALAGLVERSRQPGIVDLVEQVDLRAGPALAIARQVAAPDQLGRPSDETVGVLVALLTLESFVVGELDTGQRETGVVLLDADRHRLAGSAGPQLAATTSVARGFEGLLTLPLDNGEPAIATFRYLQLNGAQGWTLAHYMPESAALGNLRQVLFSTLAVAVLVLLIGLTAILFVARRMTAPLTELAALARHLGSGKLAQRFEPRPGIGREIAQLGAAFNLMAERIADMRQSLEETVARRTAETAAARDHLLATLDALPDFLFEVDLQGRVYGYHTGSQAQLARPASAIVGQLVTDVLPAEAAEVCLSAIREAARLGTSNGAQYRLMRPEGETWYEASVATKRTAEGAAPRFIFLARDITQRKRAEDEVRRLAFFDPLTGLANRRLMMDRLNQARLAAARSGQCNGLLLIDLDHFKDLNDTLGHQVGDQLLLEAARRFTACVREADTVARLGGDEFVILLRDVADSQEDGALEIERVAEKLRLELARPYTLRDAHGAERTHHITLSIGIAPFSDGEHSAEELLKFADTAMYQAKRAGRNDFRFYDPSMQQAVLARAALEEQLREAVAREQFVAWLQPLVNADGSCHGAELLVRWQHPSRGIVGPNEFIAHLEQSGLILPLGHWLLRQACNMLVDWQREPALAGLIVAVNLSARQIQMPAFVNETLAVLEASGADAQRLKLELTESLLLDHTEDVIAKMTALRAAGVHFALDDFGTGYSSLSYLKRLPLDQLKIDRSFVSDMLDNANDLAIAQLVLDLARTLGLSVLAEGVETAAQHERLLAMGCHAFQGYHFSKPMPRAEFEAWARARAARLPQSP